jgi:hypothetical protein
MPEPELRLDTVLHRLDEQRERLLSDRGLYPITSYGWLDADSVDPNYAGHAMWQMGSPCEPDWEVILGGGLPREEPTDTQLSLVRTGEDFSAAMLVARYSAGMALCTNHALDAYRIDDDEYWMHVATSILWLGIASDRIRDYFTLAYHGVIADDLPHKRGDPWATPFCNTKSRDDEQGAQLGQLVPLAETLQRFRKQRNYITHKIATRAAKRTHAILSKQQEHARNRTPYPSPPDLSFEELQMLQSSTTVGDERERDLRDIAQWYECLVQVSNIVFEIEYGRRRQTEANGE